MRGDGIFTKAEGYDHNKGRGVSSMRVNKDLMFRYRSVIGCVSEYNRARMREANKVTRKKWLDVVKTLIKEGV